MNEVVSITLSLITLCALLGIIYNVIQMKRKLQTYEEFIEPRYLFLKTVGIHIKPSYIEPVYNALVGIMNKEFNNHGVKPVYNLRDKCLLNHLRVTIHDNLCDSDAAQFAHYFDIFGVDEIKEVGFYFDIQNKRFIYQPETLYDGTIDWNTSKQVITDE